MRAKDQWFLTTEVFHGDKGKPFDAYDERSEAGNGAGGKFDDTGIANAYANVCNVSSSQEEVVLVFGMNNTWEREAGEIRVQLNSRVILSPFAAKRLALLLNSVVQQYETRFGGLDVGLAQADRATGK